MFSKGLKEDNVYIATQGNMIIHCTFVNYMPPPKKKRLGTVNVAFHCFLTLFLGPKQNTVADFWCMVWQEHIEQIIMLTNVMEGNTVNNDSYIFVLFFFVYWFFYVIGHSWVHMRHSANFTFWSRVGSCTILFPMQ